MVNPRQIPIEYSNNFYIKRVDGTEWWRGDLIGESADTWWTTEPCYSHWSVAGGHGFAPETWVVHWKNEEGEEKIKFYKLMGDNPTVNVVVNMEIV
jgi:hypothetical protein